MKSLKIMMIATLMLMMFASVSPAGDCTAECDKSCCAETDIKVFGSFRYRLDIDDKSFDKDSPACWTQYTRSRLGVKASRGNTGMVFEVQDSRVLGEAPGTFDFTNGHNHVGFSYDPFKEFMGSYRNDFGLRQAYMWHKPCDKGVFKLGRFGVNLHNQRLVGEVNWSNIGRTTEGLMFKRGLNDNISIIGAALQIQELNRVSTADNDLTAPGDKIMDEMFYIFDVHFAEQNVDLFLYYWNHPGDGSSMDEANWKHMTFGAYSEREFGSNMFYDAMFAMQSGTEEYDDGTKAVQTMDYSGMLVNAQIGMKLDGGTKISALVDYTTGDDPDTPEYEAFFNLLWTGHKWNGAMDYFNTGWAGFGSGLTDLGLRVAHPVNETTWIKGDFHLFTTTQEYAITDGTSSSVGNEIDLTIVKKTGDMKIMGGVSFFMPSEDWAGADAATSKWAYLQTSFGF